MKVSVSPVAAHTHASKAVLDRWPSSSSQNSKKRVTKKARLDFKEAIPVAWPDLSASDTAQPHYSQTPKA
jgi:hypothetical protein